MPLIPMIVDAVAPIPVLAAGDWRGLVAALALGVEGILLGTRFLATVSVGFGSSILCACLNCKSWEL